MRLPQVLKGKAIVLCQALHQCLQRAQILSDAPDVGCKPATQPMAKGTGSCLDLNCTVAGSTGCPVKLAAMRGLRRACSGLCRADGGMKETRVANVAAMIIEELHPTFVTVSAGA
jgi:hypothetical protein